MKSLKSHASCLAAAAALALTVAPSIGWSTHAPAGVVSGEITATPSGTEIEVAHHSYHIKMNSAAQKTVRNFAAGDKVHLILNGPAEKSTSEVVSIAPHPGS